MFDRLKSLFSRRGLSPLQEQINLKRQELEVKLLESQLSLYDMMVDPMDWPWADTPDFLGFPYGPSSVPIHLDHQGRGEVLPIYLTWFQLKMIRDNSRKLCAFNEFAINAMENRISYVSGKGFKYTAVRRDNKIDPTTDGLCRLVQAHLDQWMDSNDWCSLEQEIIRRCDRDGECFLRFFDQGRGNVEIRFIEPEFVRPENADALDSFGIHTEPGDTVKVVGYDVVIDPTEGYATEYVDAEDILHIKTNTDSTAKRGLPLLFPVRKNLERADRLLRNASILAQVRATYAVIRKHTGPSAGAIAAFQQNNADWSTTDPISGRAKYQQRLQPGSVLDTGGMTEYEFPSSSVQATEYVAILQAELRAVAARLNMPEYMLTSDASNANFASTMVAESPWVKHAERLQAFYSRKFGCGVYYPNKHLGVLWRVLKSAVDFGILPAETLAEIDVQAEGSSLVVRDKQQETARREVLHKNKAMSLVTWQQQEGLDPATEERNFAGEKPEPSPGGDSPPPGEDGGGSPFGGESFAEDTTVGGFTGTDSRGHQWVNGKQVKKGKEPSDDPRAKGGVKKGSEHVAAAVQQLDAEVKEMASTPAGKQTLAKADTLATKVKSTIAKGVKAALDGLDGDGAISLLVSGAKNRDAGAMVAGASTLFNSVFQCVHEEVFENAMSQHSIPGAHMVGMVAANVAAKAEQGLLKAVAWSLNKVRGVQESLGLMEAMELTDNDKSVLAALAKVAADAVKSIYREAGVSDVEVNADAAAKRIEELLRRQEGSPA